MSKVTAEQFQEQFGSIMMHGLNSRQTYIPLRTNARYGINVAIRPMVIRVSSGIVLFGGKLRVGYTLDENHNQVKTNVTEISDEVKVQRLQDFCKGFSWIKGGPERFSTVVGFGVAATKFDKAGVLDHLEQSTVAEDFINRLESTYKQYNDVSFGNNKAAAAAALNAAWILQSEGGYVFKDLQDFTPLPEGVVGKQTKLLNQAQDKYHDNVVSFQDKINDWAAAEAEATVEQVDSE